MARFGYWWEGAGENGEAIPIYKVKVECGWTDVARESLEIQGKRIPRTPDFETWKREVSMKRRCPRCYRRLRGTNADYLRHTCVAQLIKGARV